MSSIPEGNYHDGAYASYFISLASKANKKRTSIKSRKF